MQDSRFQLLQIPTFEEFLTIFGENVLLQAGTAILLSLLAAKIGVFILTRGLGRLARRTPNQVDEKIISLLRRPVFFSIVLSGLATAMKLLDFPDTLRHLGLGLAGTLAALIWLLFGMQVIVLLLRWMSRHPERFTYVQPPTLPFFEIVTKLILIGAGVYFVFLAWDIDVTAWLASAGIIGIIIGLAAQSTLANLFAGVFILADASYKVGDVIVVEGDRGLVTKIGMRSTRILTRDDIEIIIPNAIMGNSKIINESGGPSVKRRIRVPVGIAYGSDLEQAKRILMDSIQEHDMVTTEPAPRVRFREFGESSLNLEILCWISDPQARGLVTDQILTAVYQRFMSEGVTIPFPQRDLHIKEWPAARDQKNLME